MLTMLLVAALGGPAVPGSLTAHVNDPLSHGTLGDNLLSLDEAIRLANHTLIPGMLSPAEAAQLSGSGTMVDRIVIDAMVTPHITLQNPLTPIAGMAMMSMGMIVIEGMPMMTGSGMVKPRLIGGTHGHVLALHTDMAEVMGLRFEGGQVAIDARMAGSGSMTSGMAMVTDCEFDQQTSAGLRVSASAAENSSLMVMHSHLMNMPRGILVDEQTSTGTTMVECEHVHMENVALGAEVQQAGSGTRMSMLMIFRSRFEGGANFMRVRRPVASSTQQYMIRVVHCHVATTGDAIDVQGVANAVTMVHHHHSDLHAPGARAMYVWPRTANFDFHGSEVHFVGDVVVGASLFTQRLWQQNNHYRNGTITIDSDGSVPNLLWNRYENCTIRVPAGARAPVRIRSSELWGTAVDGQSALAPITLDRCYRNGGSQAGHSSETNAAPGPFLGMGTVTPEEPRIGTSVAVTTDLPFGVGVLWHFTVSDPRPNTAQEPVRFYGDPLNSVLLPGMVVFQSRIDVPVPNHTNLVGLEFYVQPVAIPLLNQAWMPPYHLPRGGLLRPTL